jgi:hypothetical protein
MLLQIQEQNYGRFYDILSLSALIEKVANVYYNILS